MLFQYLTNAVGRCKIWSMKKRVFICIVAVLSAMLIIFNLAACSSYTRSLVFYEIQENDSYGTWAGEISVVDNTNKSIKKLVVPQTYKGKSVVMIGACAFAGCDALTDVQLPEGLKTIEDNSFAFCESLTEIKLPESLLFIGWGAFERDSELISITIGKSVFRIAEKAFKDCNKLQDVHYNGTQEEWDKIEIWEGNELLLNADIHFAN